MDEEWDFESDSDENPLLRERRILKVENGWLKRALRDQQAFIAAVQCLRDHQALRLEVERLRLEVERLKSRR